MPQSAVPEQALVILEVAFHEEIKVVHSRNTICGKSSQPKQCDTKLQIILQIQLIFT